MSRRYRVPKKILNMAYPAIIMEKYMRKSKSLQYLVYLGLEMKMSRAMQ